MQILGADSEGMWHHKQEKRLEKEMSFFGPSGAGLVTESVPKKSILQK